MTGNEELILIIAKDGKDWTPEESVLVYTFIKSHGRQALKALRKELRELIAQYEE